RLLGQPLGRLYGTVVPVGTSGTGPSRLRRTELAGAGALAGLFRPIGTLSLSGGALPLPGGPLRLVRGLSWLPRGLLWLLHGPLRPTTLRRLATGLPSLPRSAWRLWAGPLVSVHGGPGVVRRSGTPRTLGLVAVRSAGPCHRNTLPLCSLRTSRLGRTCRLWLAWLWLAWGRGLAGALRWGLVTRAKSLHAGGVRSQGSQMLRISRTRRLSCLDVRGLRLSLIGSRDRSEHLRLAHLAPLRSIRIECRAYPAGFSPARLDNAGVRNTGNRRRTLFAQLLQSRRLGCERDPLVQHLSSHQLLQRVPQRPHLAAQCLDLLESLRVDPSAGLALGSQLVFPASGDLTFQL